MYLRPTADEGRDASDTHEQEGVDNAGRRNGGSNGGDGDGGGGGGSGGGGGGSEGRKPDMRRGVDLPPSGTEIRAFVGQFEDIEVNPPQVRARGKSIILIVFLFFFFPFFSIFFLQRWICVFWIYSSAVRFSAEISVEA